MYKPIIGGSYDFENLKVGDYIFIDKFKNLSLFKNEHKIMGPFF